MLISQQLHQLNNTYSQRATLTASEKISLIHARIELRNALERLGGNLVFDQSSNKYVVELQKKEIAV